MKKILTLAILGVTGLAGAAGAEANEGRRPQDYRPHSAVERREHRGRRENRPGRVWIAPRYETRIVRYECGRPVYGQVLLSAGHWSFEAECR